MGQINRIFRNVEGGRLAFWCPGCQDRHEVRVEGEGRPKWCFNGNLEAATFTPSILVTSGHYTDLHKAGDECWCTYNAQHPEEPSRFRCYRCHSFVTDGKIQFLSDCTHELAGQTVPLVHYPAG